MVAAAIALRYAFPYMLYAIGLNTASHYSDFDDDGDAGTGGRDEKRGLIAEKAWKNGNDAMRVGEYPLLIDTMKGRGNIGIYFD